MLALTLSAFACCYFYELGTCSYYKIPAEYIVINISNYTGAIFFTCFLLALMVWLLPIYLIFKHKVIRLAIILSIIGFYLYTVLPSSKVTDIQGLQLFIVCSITTGCGMCLISYLRRLKIKIEGLNIPIATRALLNTRAIGIWIMLFSVLCHFFFMMGIKEAECRKKYYGIKSQQIVLLRRYGNANIFGKIYKGTLIKGTAIIIKDNDKIDTLTEMELLIK